MKNLEWHYIDKSDWIEGEWQNEPDKIQWTDEVTQLPCLIVRNDSGALCGYVGIAEDHKYFACHYDEPELRVHGGITFGGFCQERKEGICHIVEEGENDRVYWLGFDCAHSGDLMPFFQQRMDLLNSFLGERRRHLEYRNVDFVKAECAKLAKQLFNLSQ